MERTARSILAIDASPFGNALGLIPSIRALRAGYPQSSIVAASSTGICQLLARQNLVDDVIDLGIIRAEDRQIGSSLKRFLSLAKRARRFGFDLILDFAPRIDTELVSRLLIRQRTVTATRLPPIIGQLLAWGQSRYVDRQDRESTYASVLKQAGLEYTERRYGIVPSEESNHRFEGILSRRGSKGAELIALLYAADPVGLSGWPLESFGDLGLRLANNLDVRVVISDEPCSSDFTDRMSGRVPAGVIKLAAPQSDDFVAAVARASIIVTDDQDIAALACELGTPAVEITLRRNTGSSSETHQKISASSPKKVLVDEVFEAAARMLQASRSQSLFRR